MVIDVTFCDTSWIDYRVVPISNNRRHVPVCLPSWIIVNQDWWDPWLSRPFYYMFFPFSIFGWNEKRKKWSSSKKIILCQHSLSLFLSQCKLPYLISKFCQHFKSSFYARRFQKHQKYSQVVCLFCAFGISLHIKAALKTLMKLTFDLEVLSPIVWLKPFSNILIAIAYLRVKFIFKSKF